MLIFSCFIPDLYFLDIYKVSTLSYSLLRSLYNGETGNTSHNSRAPWYIYGFVENLSTLFWLCIRTQKLNRGQEYQPEQPWTVGRWEHLPEWKEEVITLCYSLPVYNWTQAISLQQQRTEAFRITTPDGCRTRSVFSWVHHPSDVGFLRRVQTVAGFLLPQHLDNKKQFY